MKIVIYLFLASGLAQVLKAIPETGNPPPARTKGVLLYHSSLKKVFVFAGQESSAVIFDDIWTYDLSSSTWEQVYPLNSGPGD
jgi:lipid-binding SYLF domain-containing protein